jgi:hypothetical protein
MSYDRYKEWGVMVCPEDETKRRVVLYSVYDIQDYNEELHWGSKAMEPEVAEHMVEYLKQYRQDLVTRK